MGTPGTPANDSHIVLTAPEGGVVRGRTYFVADKAYVARETVDEGLPFSAFAFGAVWAAKDPTISIDAGARLYLDESTGLLSTGDDSVGPDIGAIAIALASTADDAVAIMLGVPAPIATFTNAGDVTGASLVFGHPLDRDENRGRLQLCRIKAGTGLTVSQGVDGTITIAVSGGGGG